MGRLCLRNFFCSSDLKIFLLAKCSLTPPVGEHWRSLNNTRTAIALHWERFYPSHLKKVNCSSEIHSTSSSQNQSVRKMRIHQILCSHIDKLITYILISSLLGRTSKDTDDLNAEQWKLTVTKSQELYLNKQPVQKMKIKQ